MKLLVTGGAGYIGSHTAHQLVDEGHQVVVLDNLYSGNRWAVPEKAQFVEGSISDFDLLSNLMEKESFDAVLHFAAHTEVGESIENPQKYYKNNTLASLVLFEAALAHGISKLVFSSTAAVYGEPKTSEPLSESAPTSPMNPYGHSKLMTEHMLTDLARASGDKLRFVILRYFNAAGARRDLKLGQATPRATHLIKRCAEVATGKVAALKIHGNDYPTPDGTCLRDYIHIEDLSQAHIDSLKYLSAGETSDIFNVGYGKPSSVKAVIASFERASGKKLPTEIGARRPGDPSSVTADIRKIQNRLGWKPRFNDLDLICKTAFDWELKLPK